MDDRIEQILSEMADAEAAAELRVEAGRATESDPAAARTARGYECLARLLGSWRTLPQAVDWNALTARVSRSVATERTDGDRSHDADRLLTQWAKPLPQVDWNALSARISRAVRAEAVEKRRRSVREALGAWGLRVAGPLAVAAALAFAAIWWLPGPSTTGSGPGEAIVVVELAQPGSMGIVTVAFDESPYEPPAEGVAPHGQAMAFAMHPGDFGDAADDGYYY